MEVLSFVNIFVYNMLGQKSSDHFKYRVAVGLIPAKSF